MFEPETDSQISRSRPLRLVEGADRSLRVLEGGAAILSAALILLIMLLISGDAVARYVFNSPLTFAYELVTMYLMPSALLLCLSYTLRRGGHVNVEILESLLPQRLLFSMLAIILMALLPLLWTMVYRNGINLVESYEAGEVTTGYYSWPIWLTYVPVFIGMALLMLRVLLIAVGCACAAVTGRAAYAAHVGSYQHLDLTEPSL